MLLETTLKHYGRILWALLRPQTYLLLSIYFSFGLFYGIAVTATDIESFLLDNGIRVGLVLFALASWYIAGTSFNDYADYEIDKINLRKDKQRPLVQGIVTKKGLLRIGIISSLVSFTCAIFVNDFRVVGLFSFLLILNVCYSLPPFKISHRSSLAPMLLPLGYVLLTVGSGYALSGDETDRNAWLVLCGVYVHFMSRIVLKDFRDVEGDKKTGKRTLTILYGGAFIAWLSLSLFLVSSLMLTMTLLDYIRFIFPVIALIIGAAATILVKLKDETLWVKQRPLISMYGRLCSILLTIFLICFIASANTLPRYVTTAFILAVTALMYTSLFDIQRLQSGSKT